MYTHTNTEIKQESNIINQYIPILLKNIGNKNENYALKNLKNLETKNRSNLYLNDSTNPNFEGNKIDNQINKNIFENIQCSREFNYEFKNNEPK